MSQTRKINPYDFEPVDDTPVSIPTRLKLPQSRTDQMREFIRREMSIQAAEQGEETFEEADDFEIDEEDTPLTRYEMLYLEPPAEEPAPPLQNGVKAEGQPPDVPAASPEGNPPATPKAPADGS